MKASGPHLALGTVQFGLAYGIAGRDKPVAEDEVREILRRAADAGVTRLDTAAGYGDIENRLAKLVGQLPFEVVSKVPAIPAGLRLAEARDFVRSSIRQSHARLGTLLRGLMFHRAEDLADPQGAIVWEAAAELGERLRIPVGVSSYGPEVVRTLRRSYPLRMVQIPGNAFDQRAGAAASDFSGVEISLRSLFLQGLLLMPEDQAAQRLPAAAGHLARWHAWCQAQDLAPLRAALAIAKGMTGARYCVVGVDDVAQFEEIAADWYDTEPMAAPELATSRAAVIDPRCWAKRE